MENYDKLSNAWEQFSDMDVPKDIQELKTYTRDDLEEEINKKRMANNLKKINLSGQVCINYNSRNFRPDEINIWTVDLFYSYTPDFDWTHIAGEVDPWRRTCKLKMNYKRFSDIGINIIRTDEFIQKIYVCEGYTFFEDSFKLLKKDGVLILKYIDLMKISEAMIKEKEYIKSVEKFERLLFSSSDPTGLYYNRTVWTYNRLQWYLGRSGFNHVEIDYDNSDEFNTTIIAKKE